MKNEKIVVQSPEPLNGGKDNGKKFYLIAAGCGLGLGVVLSLMAGGVDIFICFFFALLTTLIGWGLRNKQLKYKCFGLRNMRFMVEEKPTGQELYQKLFQVFTSLNMKVEMTSDGNLSVAKDGVYYDVIFNEDDSFSICWHQSFIRAFLRQGYYIALYKKALAAMGVIAYHVQKVCLNADEVYYEPSEPVEVPADISLPEKKEKPKQNTILVVVGAIVAWVIGLYLMIFVIGAVIGVFETLVSGESDYATDSYMWNNDMEDEKYASVLEDYLCDMGGYNKEEVYALIDAAIAEYSKNDAVNFTNMQNWSAGLRFNEFMRYNEEYIGTGMVLEGEIKNKVGNIIEIYDTPSFDEYVQMGEAGYTGTNVDIYYGADVSLTGRTPDEFYEGDQVQVIGVYCGKIHLENGEYTPAIVAIDIYTTNAYY